MSDTGTLVAEKNGNGHVQGAKPKQPTDPEAWTVGEVGLKGEKRACLHVRLLDDGQAPSRIINVNGGATVEMELELIGPGWGCDCGFVRFTVDFSGGADAKDFTLEALADVDVAKGVLPKATIDIPADSFVFDGNIGDYRVSVNALQLNTAKVPQAVAGGADLGYVAAYRV
ncbi:MAG: hypothetical protein AAGA99_19570 [Actinomycetota bacterium]